ncbi:hypothetical protein ABBQ32_011494 [Trebouxia sp. C0010 RCD-2024]
MLDVSVSPVSKLADEMKEKHWLAEDAGGMTDGDAISEVVRRPLQTADPSALASRYNSTPSSNGTPQLMQDASPSPTPYICRRRSSSSSSHTRRKKLRGPSASADFDLNKENRMQEWLCPGSSIQQATKAKRKLYCGHSPPATATRRGPAKRQCLMYQSMPGSSRFDGFGALGGPLSRANSQLNPLPEGGAPAQTSVPHVDTYMMVEGAESLHPNQGRSSMSHKPPLSPYYSSAQPLVSGFSASFSMFSADRVQSSPCIMQTNHAELHEDDRPIRELTQAGEASAECLAGSGQRLADTDAVLPGNSDTRTSGLVQGEPCDLWSAIQMEGCAVLDSRTCSSPTQQAVGADAALLIPTVLEPQSGIGPSTVGDHGLHQAAGMQSRCQTFDEPDLQKLLGSGQASAGLPAASSPCCPFLLPAALSQGISASPASSGDSSAEGSARRKSFSPLESGPVSILPLVDNALIGLPSVSCSTLAQLLAGQQDSRTSVPVKIVDCRYPYEYEGGHIPGSINIANPDDGVALTFGSNATSQGQNTAIILYCEFSSERAPRLFRYLRNMDRRNHLADYPKLTFPHMYVLKGGYQTFHEQYPTMCNPQHAYVRMHDAAHLEDHKACRKIVKAAWDLKAACSRSFG